MSVFKDCNGDKYRVSFDAFNLSDTKKETGIDLADVSAGGWHAIETDATAVVLVLSVVCSDEIKARKRTAKDFSLAMRGDAIQAGREALMAEAADFFPVSEWSAIRANLSKRTTMESALATARMTEIIPLMEAFSRLPAETQNKLIASGGDTSSLPSDASLFAFGPTATPLNVATDSPESAELTDAG